MILMVYNEETCREFVLPERRSSEYKITLEPENSRDSAILKLESGKDGWKLIRTEGYRILAQGVEVGSQILKEDEMLIIVDKRQVRYTLLAIKERAQFCTTKKYSIAKCRRIVIGKASECSIQYDFNNLISGKHAEIVLHSTGWYLTDFSSNGTFLPTGRLRGTRKLNVGDHIIVFGLHIIFFGDMLAIQNGYGTLHVNEEVLLPYVPEYKDWKGWSQGNTKEERAKENFFNRSPRNLPFLYEESVEIEAPPVEKELKQKPWFLVVGPSLTMAIPMMLGCILMIWGASQRGYGASVYMFTGLVTALGSAILGTFWAIKNVNFSREELREEEERRFNAYSNYLASISEMLRAKYEYNSETMRSMYPSASACTRIDRENPLLWSRNHMHSDFLYHRLGVGNVPFQVTITVPKEKFTLKEDVLAKKPHQIYQQFKTLREVPVGISLKGKQLIGLVGGSGKRGSIELMHSIVADIAATHCYTDVKFVFLYDREQLDQGTQKEWECMKWFPHVWSEDRQMRYMASTDVERRDVLFELSNIMRTRIQGMDKRSKNGIPKPYYFIFISDPQILEGELLEKYIYEPNPIYGMTAFLMAERVDQLPNICEDVIQKDAYFKGYYNLLEGAMQNNQIVLDITTMYELEAMGKRLADVRVNETETTSEIPSVLDFFSMYGVRRLEEFDAPSRWRKNLTYNSMKALIGKKSGNTDCYLDVHEKYHGPHGLVAGTTGSGKSETLQTYILSLALNFSPEDVVFFLIDFKGGGMANLFEGLPHVAGSISNLSGNQIQRAMISIKSENIRRQKIFTEHGVNNINLYTRLYKNREVSEPVPHLFIIIDEFAELKKEEPEFMKELISVAQVGRSLGVHLILATQKPSGTVDDNIWSNSRFRLCLRVQDRQDSNDMLHKPDAAFITCTGRGYLQVGNDEIYEQFQSGYSGAAYDMDLDEEGADVNLLTLTGRIAIASNRIQRMKKSIVNPNAGRQEITQIQAIMEYLKQTAKEMGNLKARRLWVPLLPREYYVEPGRISSEKWSLAARVGLYDDPSNQRQDVFEINFSTNGHVAVCGAVVSGKSTFLQTLVYQLIRTYTPAEFQCYIIDYSSHLLASFEQDPHVGGIVYDGQGERLNKFIYLLEQLMEKRKRLFQGGSFGQYVQANGASIPAILVVIDNYGGLREKTESRYDDALLRLAKEGPGYGMYLAISAAGYGVSEIQGRMADTIKTVLCLEQSDKYKYMEILRTTHLSSVPEPGIKGRGMAFINGQILEFQTALAKKAEDDFARGRMIEAECRESNLAWDGERPEKIPEIPENPTLGMIEELPEYKRMTELGERIPFAYSRETASVFGVCLQRTFCYTISGKSLTGKTNVLRLLISGAAKSGMRVCVIDGKQPVLKKWTDEHRGEYYSTIQEIFQFFQKLTSEFVRRNKIKKAFLEEGMDEGQIYRRMSREQAICIFIDDLKDFFDRIYRAEEQVGNMSGFMENIMEKGSLHGIYFFGCVNTDESGALQVYKAYRSYTGGKRGVHLGGNLSGQKIFSFQNISYTELGKSLKKGEGYASDDEDDSMGVRIVVPLARRNET